LGGANEPRCLWDALSDMPGSGAFGSLPLNGRCRWPILLPASGAIAAGKKN